MTNKSKKSKPVDTSGTNQQKPSNGLNRRSFIGLAGVAAAAPLLASPMGATESKAGNTPQNTSDTKDDPKCPVEDPGKASETWDEPWVWEPGRWPGETLHLNVVEHQTPSTIVGLGNPNAALFSYNGATPGPTIRMKGDETLRVKLFNHLGINQGTTPIGPAVDTAWFAEQPTKGADTKYQTRCDWELGEHLNGIHAIHTTNMHTHGLHVRPGLNTDGTHSDNIYLRVIPLDDLIKRETDPNYNGDFLLEGEQAGEAQFEFRLGEAGNKKIAKHPPGTHWYHPHSHGSTNMEVASGMAGFLVVEGDVDEAINEYMTSIKDPDTTVKTGNFGYRERLMMLQRVLLPAVDKDSERRGLKKGATPATNGSPGPDIILMNPGDVERWRVLNGSVDGKGYVRFMVLEGQWVSESPTKVQFLNGKRDNALKNIETQLNTTKQLLYVADDGQRYLPSTADIESRKQHLYQLAQDGVTLVRKQNGKPQYYVKDLQNNHPNPLFQDYSNLEACYKDANNLKACYNLPNELYMAPANRADFFFQAPDLKKDEAYTVYTVIAKGTAIHTENEQRALDLANYYIDQVPKGKTKEEEKEIQKEYGNIIGVSVPGDTIMAYVVVRAGAVTDDPNKDCVKAVNGPSYSFSMKDLMKKVNDVPVPEYLYPIEKSEVKVTVGDEDYKGANAGKYRTRRVTYHGWGSATWPCLESKRISKINANGEEPKINKLFLYEPKKDGVKGVGTVVSPPATRTMGIDGKKFNPDDHMAPKPLLDTAEEWVVYNNTISLWHKYPKLSSLKMKPKAQVWRIEHMNGHPITRKKARTNGMGCSTRGIDHPFHIHTNPFWLMRIEVPDDEGNLVNILPEPRWQDVIWLPRNGGRVVFRARFPDYVGKMVNHCHILQHEDNGMMQEVQITQSIEKTNYTPANDISDVNHSPSQLSGMGGVYAPQGLQEAYRQCSRVIDDNHMSSPELPLAYEFPAKNGVFDPPRL